MTRAHLRMTHLYEVFCEEISWIHHYLAVCRFERIFSEVISWVLLKYLLFKVANDKRLKLIRV